MEPYTHKAQYYETDQMGCIHHSNYIRWFEEARIFFFEQVGCSYHTMEHELKLISPVLEVTAQYRSMVHFNDVVDISIHVEAFNGIKLKLAYEVRDHESGELRTTGTSSHCFLNEKGQPVSLKRNFPDIFARLQAHV